MPAGSEFIYQKSKDPYCTGSNSYRAMVYFTFNNQKWVCGEPYTLDWCKHIDMYNKLIKVAQAKQLELLNANG